MQFKCSKTCGLGVSSRKVECFNYLNNSTFNECDEDDKPDHKKECNQNITCPIETTSKVQTIIKTTSLIGKADFLS